MTVPMNFIMNEVDRSQREGKGEPPTCLLIVSMLQEFAVLINLNQGRGEIDSPKECYWGDRPCLWAMDLDVFMEQDQIRNRMRNDDERR